MCVRHAGGVADALNEQYNDQLRDLRTSGVADSAEAAPLREALRDLRDQPRWAGSVKARPSFHYWQHPWCLFHCGGMCLDFPWTVAYGA